MGVLRMDVRWQISETVEIAIPSHLFDYAERQRSTYVRILANESVDQDHTESHLEFCSGFISYIAGRAKTNLRDELIDLTWNHLENDILGEIDIHSLAATQTKDQKSRQRIIRRYFDASLAAGTVRRPRGLSLHARAGAKVTRYGVFGGQGNTTHYFEEIRNVVATYQPLVHDLVEALSRHLLHLSESVRVSEQYKDGLDVMQWLLKPDTTPSETYLISAPVSFPLLSLLQLLYIKAILMSLGLTPADIPNVFRGLSGHSQGVVVACAVSTASDWQTYQEAAIKAVTILFWIGARCQQAFSQEPLSQQVVQEFQSKGYGSASPMLSVSGISRSVLETAISETSKTCRSGQYATLALVNTDSHFVVSGSERSLGALIRVLEICSPKPTSVRTQIPYSQRKPSASIRFLPVTIPCHCGLLDPAIPAITEDLQKCLFPAGSLRLPVNMLTDGSSLTTEEPHEANLVPRLVRMVVSDPVDWSQCDFEEASQIIDFGPGAASGIGVLTNRNVGRPECRIIVAGMLAGTEESEIGSLVELFSNRTAGESSWSDEHRVSIVRTVAGLSVATKFSRLFGLPPFLVAGMTPTTTRPEFVAAVMKAGYPVEFAAGGYNDAASLRSALYKLRDMMPVDRTITINVIYVSPKALAWQLPLIRQLRAEGFPLTGMTVGGGVPSLEVATDYITTLGLEHISFKPGTVAGIRQVIDIAKKIQPFPVILQWTGGRGGGHHSAEDFHAPLSETYAAIRKCKNLILVGGSGFGCSDDVIPYLTGAWSLDRGHKLAMPLDGVLFGSRVMTCAEAHTSHDVKAQIAAAPGVDDSQWDGTYQKAVGGVISVISEMGEPIHVIANRGAQLWADLDKSIFTLDKTKRVAALAKRRTEVIARLNADYQKPWFGEKFDGQVCDIVAMTYGEVAQRLARLTFIHHQSRWIDSSYSRLFADWLLRVEARFIDAFTGEDDKDESSMFDHEAILRQGPATALHALVQTFPDASTSPLCPDDCDYFLQLCTRSGQKPVPFIPALDEHFERWFKKDSLWQSEQLEAVVDQDAGRVFILHGPVAARHTCKIDEPVGEVLDGINDGVVQNLIGTDYSGNPSRVPFEEFLLPNNLAIGATRTPSASAIASNASITHPRLKTSRLWMVALLECRSVTRGLQLIENPIRRLFEGVTVDAIKVSEESISLYDIKSEKPNRLLLYVSKRDSEIECLLYTYTTSSGHPVSLSLRFEYHPESSYAPIWECSKGREERIRSMYSHLWDHVKPSPDTSVFEAEFNVQSAQIDKFNRAVGARLDTVPLDFAIVPAWGPICGALLHQPVRGDLLSLVHLSNSFEADSRAEPIKINENLKASARITSVTIDDAGKTVEVTCELRRTPDGRPVVRVLSRFLYRGTYTDLDSTFTQKIEPPYELQLSSSSDIALLDSKPWFCVDNSSTLDDLDLTNVTLEFHLRTITKHNSVSITGTAHVRSEDGLSNPVGNIKHFAHDKRQSPVLSYLSRRGRVVDSSQVRKLSPVSPAHVSYLTTPASNESYSAASGDFNPIHTSPSFAKLAGLPGTITHGMYCSAAVRQALERHIGGQRYITRYQTSFTGMVLPNQVLKVSIRHTGMQAGLSVYDIEVQEVETGIRVLTASASATQPRTTIVFTGQGSQEKGMGMDLYASSTVARAIWDRADAYFLTHLGVSILDIVRNNPKEIKVHFGGVRGRELRRKYKSMQDHVQNAAGKLEAKPLFPTIGEETMSFTHSSPKGLLFATQFAQPALAIMEMVAFRDMQAAGVVGHDFRFTGHSLGEWVALACGTDFLSFEDVLKFFFYRGMTMQGAVERDAFGRSVFSMAAVDPSRMRKDLDESSMQELVLQIGTRTGFFIEVVNFNIRNSQYVCAGDSRALDLVQKVADDLNVLPITNDLKEDFAALITKHIGVYENVTAPEMTLRRGSATIPLAGMDVPFHSSSLRPKMQAWKHMLEGMVGAESFQPSLLVGKYVPNVTGTPFSISKEYFEQVWKITRSEPLQEILGNWNIWMGKVQEDRSGDYYSSHHQLTSADGQARPQACY